MAPNPLVNIPALRSLAGFFGLSKGAAPSAVRGLYSLVGGLVQNDTDVRDVVNALVSTVDAGNVIAAIDVSLGNVVLTAAQAAADVLLIIGTSDLARTVTFPAAATFARPDGTPLRIVNFSTNNVTIVDPWGTSSARLPMSAIAEAVWHPTTTAINLYAFFASATSLGFDAFFGSMVGSIIYRSAAGWVALAPGAAGTKLTSGGVGVAPYWI